MDSSSFNDTLNLAKLEALHSIIYSLKTKDYGNISYLSLLRNEMFIIKFKLQHLQVIKKRTISSVLSADKFKETTEQLPAIYSLYNEIDQLMEEHFCFTAIKGRKCKPRTSFTSSLERSATNKVTMEKIRN